MKADAVVVDVAADGTAVVSHEMLLRVRGGPLDDIVVDPVDTDAESMPGATATLAQSGQAAGLPIPLTPSREGSRLSLHVERDRGLGSGTYQIRFQYRTDLRAQHRLEATKSDARVVWNGPSYSEGLDSARVVFRLPRAPTPPRLTAAQVGDDGAGIADDRNGVFLSTFRRVEDKDELEIVRPHVSKGEVVSWSIVLDGAAFGAEPALAAPAESPKAPQPSPARAGRSPAAPRWLFGLFALAVAGLYGLLIASKARWVADACGRVRATPRTLLPASTRVRALLGTGGLAGAICAAALEMPWISAASVMVAFVAAVHLAPSAAPPLRGPGTWSKIAPEAAFEGPRRASPLPGRLFDAGSPLGFVLFLSLLAAVAAGALFLARVSPFHGVALGLSAALLFPVFCTGREAELHEPFRALDSLSWLHDELSREPALSVHPIGRIPRGGEEPDEIRLLVLPQSPVPGLSAIEVGFDAHEGMLGILDLPFVIVRVVDGSAAQDCIPKSFYFTRGRSPDERVVVLRPKLPTRALARDLVRDLGRRLEAPGESRQPPRSAARSRGNGASASKGGTSSSPAHAT